MYTNTDTDIHIHAVLWNKIKKIQLYVLQCISGGKWVQVKILSQGFSVGRHFTYSLIVGFLNPTIFSHISTIFSQQSQESVAGLKKVNSGANLRVFLLERSRHAYNNKKYGNKIQHANRKVQTFPRPRN